MTLEVFLKRLDQALRDRAAAHPARVCFDLARETSVLVEFAGPEGHALGPRHFDKWWTKGGPDPFIDGEGRATLRIKASHRINDWAVLNVKLLITGLVVEKRYLMVRSWVTDEGS